MIVHHRWLSVMLHSSYQYPRAYRTLSLGYRMLLNLTVAAGLMLLVDSSHDHSSCEKSHTQRECLSVGGVLDTSTTSQCIWYTSSDNSEGLSDSGAFCGYREPAWTQQEVWLFAIVSMLVALPLGKLVDYALLQLAAGDAISSSSTLKKTSTPEEDTVTEIENYSRMIGAVGSLGISNAPTDINYSTNAIAGIYGDQFPIAKALVSIDRISWEEGQAIEQEVNELLAQLQHYFLHGSTTNPNTGTNSWKLSQARRRFQCEYFHIHSIFR